MATEWIVLIFAAAIMIISVVGAMFGLNFNIVLETLREFMKNLKERAKENKKKKQGDSN